MRIERIATLDDPRLSDYRGLTDITLRRRSEPAGGLYIAESPKVISRALSAGHLPRSALIQEQWLEDIHLLLSNYDIPVFVGTPETIESLTGYNLHRGALAAMHRPQLPSVTAVLAHADRVVVIEDIVDHTNVGAIFRSVAGLGADAVLVTPRCADPLYRRSIRVSMGTVFQVPWTRVDPWPDSMSLLRSLGFQTVALALNTEAESLDGLSTSVPDRLALILGTEGNGLAARTVARCDRVVAIPMQGGVDSLNVAAAAAVALWETRRR